ncbi:hypothetical protein HMN09_00820800 [Mycena chlorophos]|uniref:Succinate dehydrogenase assembly factor 3 n=1 Tax=Mycena chlorophos TaxID=658473 RepID=A0A8H6W7D3_MYCCL|nr:hypothetical protein HMN09_00820800 [Mycena chlorophos]
MRASLTRLAENLSKQPLNAQHVQAALLPPKPLFRRILRAHRELAADLRYMGDGYVKAGTTFVLPPPLYVPECKNLVEFHRHQAVTNPVHVMGFLAQWKMYLDTLPRGEGSRDWRGQKLDATVFEKMSKEQLGQLHELMHAAKDVWKNPPPDAGSASDPPP